MNKNNAKSFLLTARKTLAWNDNMIMALMCVLAKESGFSLARERGYKNTSNARIRKIFGGRLGPIADDTLSSLKKNTVCFFNTIYNGVCGNGLNDGYRYRGGPYNHITGRKWYKRMSYPGVDLITRPELIEMREVAETVTINFFVRALSQYRKKILKRFGEPESLDLETAVEMFANINAGMGYSKKAKVVKRATQNALKYLAEVESIFTELELPPCA